MVQKANETGIGKADSTPRPHLDERCSRHFQFRDLIECGETWQATRIDNRPTQHATYSALAELATGILDAVVEAWGRPELTYGFASARLMKAIRARSRHPGIAERLDQHASCELNRRGLPVCARLGAAVDFRVHGVGSHRLASWIIQNTPFDRLYFYGDARPMHVSTGPQRSRKIVLMRGSRGGPHIPRVITADAFLRLDLSGAM